MGSIRRSKTAISDPACCIIICNAIRKKNGLREFITRIYHKRLSIAAVICNFHENMSLII